MPVYTYYCEACGTTFDQRLSFNDPHPTRCPQCGAEALHRVYKPVGIVFKGSGFYATDHRSPSGTQKGPNDNGGTATGEKAKANAAKPQSEGAAAAKPQPAKASTGTALAKKSDKA